MAMDPESKMVPNRRGASGDFREAGATLPSGDHVRDTAPRRNDGVPIQVSRAVVVASSSVSTVRSAGVEAARRESCACLRCDEYDRKGDRNSRFLLRLPKQGTREIGAYRSPAVLGRDCRLMWPCVVSLDGGRPTDQSFLEGKRARGHSAADNGSAARIMAFSPTTCS